MNLLLLLLVSLLKNKVGIVLNVAVYHVAVALKLFEIVLKKVDVNMLLLH